MTKEGENKTQILYKSEGIKAIRADKEKKNFILCTIPDIYISKDRNPEESEICISFDDAMHKKHLGECNKTISSLINNPIKVQLNNWNTKLYIAINTSLFFFIYK